MVAPSDASSLSFDKKEEDERSISQYLLSCPSTMMDAKNAVGTERISSIHTKNTTIPMNLIRS